MNINTTNFKFNLSGLIKAMLPIWQICLKLQDLCKLSIFTLCPISQASEAPPLDIASQALPGNLLSGDSEGRIEGVAAAWNATNLADLNTIAIEHTRLDCPNPSLN